MYSVNIPQFEFIGYIQHCLLSSFKFKISFITSSSSYNRCTQCRMLGRRYRPTRSYTLTVVPGSIQHAADSGLIETRRRSIGLVGSRPVADLQRRSGRQCRLCLAVTVMSRVRRVTRRTNSPSSLPDKSNASILTQLAFNRHQSSTVHGRRARSSFTSFRSCSQEKVCKIIMSS